MRAEGLLDDQRFCIVTSSVNFVTFSRLERHGI